MKEASRASHNSQVIAFADFKVDLRAGVLSRNGTAIRLQEQPFQVLALLAEHAGEVVSREQLCLHLWPADTFVDFDNSLNAAVAKIREALEDSPNNPRFIETLPRRGYRFIATVEQSEATSQQTSPSKMALPAARNFAVKWWILGLFGLACLLMTGLLLQIWKSLQTPRVVRYTQITNDGKPKARPVSFLNTMVTDGSRIYLAVGSTKGWEIAQVPVNGGESVTVPSPFEGIVVNDISRDHSKMLLAGGTKGTEQPGSAYWILSLPGGPIERLADVRARGASWSSDGRLLAFANDRALYVANADGGQPRTLAAFGGIPFAPRWSPDGKVLRFYLYDTKNDSGGLWEISADGSNPHALFPDWPAGSETCCGLWTPNGKYFVFQGTRDGATQIWIRPEHAGFFRDKPSEDGRLTSGPMNFLGPMPSLDGKRLFVIGEQKRGELMRYDSASSQFVTYLSGLSAEDLDFSPDQESVLYNAFPEGTLWRRRMDGSERIQLTHAPLQAALPQWSPDGKRVAFMAAKPGGSWKIYLIPSEGGNPEELIQNDESQWHPNWSPKGDALIFGNPWWAATPAIHLVNLASRHISTLPDSEGLYSPRWSPDGRFVAAVSKDLRKLVLFDFTTQHWQNLALMDSVGHLAWSRKREYVYFDAATKDGVSIYRVGARDHKLMRVAAIPAPIGLAFGLFGPWTGLAPDDSPLLMRDTSVQEIYALDWQLP